MAQFSTKDLSTLPVGRLGLIPLESCQSLGDKVNDWLVKWRKERNHREMDSFAFEGYQRDSFIVGVQTPPFRIRRGQICHHRICPRRRHLSDGGCVQLQPDVPNQRIYESDVPGRSFSGSEKGDRSHRRKSPPGKCDHALPLREPPEQTCGP